MGIINFETIRALGSNSDEKHKQDLFKETLLMVLARASRVDTHVDSEEIAQIRDKLKEHTGQEFSEADVLTAASSEIFATESLDRYLARATRKLDEAERMTILGCLADIIRSDTQIRSLELDFFDRVATAMRATPSEIAGLITSN